MKITDHSIIGEAVAENYRYAPVFKSAGIDFCCNGNRTILAACIQKGIDSEELLLKLEQAASINDIQSGIDFKTWPMDLLADYIEKTHHRYVSQKITEIKPFLHKVVSVHGTAHPELMEIEKLFNDSATELSNHMKKEEMILFPFIRTMMNAGVAAESTARPHFGSVENPIAMMRNEHETEGERFRKIATLSNNYTPPEDACNTYKVTFAMLNEFEENLHEHIHLENNILFPAAIKFEQHLNWENKPSSCTVNRGN